MRGRERCCGDSEIMFSFPTVTFCRILTVRCLTDTETKVLGVCSVCLYRFKYKDAWMFTLAVEDNKDAWMLAC